MPSADGTILGQGTVTCCETVASHGSLSNLCETVEMFCSIPSIVRFSKSSSRALCWCCYTPWGYVGFGDER